MCRSALALLVVVSAAAASGQRRIIVDSSGKGHHRDIQPAISAAKPDDILVVRPGTYTPFFVNKPLTIAAPKAGAVVRATLAAPGPTTVNGLLSGKSLSIDGLTFTAPADSGGAAIVEGGLHVTHNAGTVSLTRLAVGPGRKRNPTFYALSAALVLDSCSFTGGSGGHGGMIDKSRVSASDTSFEGGADYCSSACWLREPAGHGLSVRASELHASRVTVTGGSVRTQFPVQPGFGMLVSGASRTSLNESVVAGGVQLRLPTLPSGRGLENRSANAVRASRCTFAGTPPTLGLVDTAVKLIGGTRVSGPMRSGGKASFEFHGHPRTPIVVLASTGLAPRRIGAVYETIWLGGQIIPLFARTPGPRARIALSITIPNDANLQYRALWFHALTPSGSAYAISAPVGGLILPK